MFTLSVVAPVITTDEERPNTYEIILLQKTISPIMVTKPIDNVVPPTVLPDLACEIYSG
jgi:hypothetical protein